MIVTVKEGDTIFSLSNTYSILEEKIKADNGLSSDSLVVGQSLIIDVPKRTYMPRQNTDVYSVSRMFSQSERKIFQNNYFLMGQNEVPAFSDVVIDYENTPDNSKIIGGYAYDFISPDMLYAVINYLTYIMPFTYGFTSDGNLIVPRDDFIINAAKERGVKALLHLSTLSREGGFDSSLPGTVFESDEARQALLDNIILQVRQKGYDGVDVDFEYLPRLQRENYSAFIGDLASRLHDEDKILVVALPPKTSDEQEGLLYEGIDYAALGSSADYALIMAYEYGYRFGPPMAIAPVNQVERVLDYATGRIPSEKILLGMSNYGYDWTLPYVRGQSEAPSLSPVQALNLAIDKGATIFFDEPAKAPYFNYIDDEGAEHVVYFEDARSFEAKTELMERYNLAGGFIWEIMRPNPSAYVTINSRVQIN